MQKKSGVMKSGLDAKPLFLLDDLLSANFVTRSRMYQYQFMKEKGHSIVTFFSFYIYLRFMLWSGALVVYVRLTELMMAEVPMGKTNLKIFSNFYDYLINIISF